MSRETYFEPSRIGIAIFATLWTLMFAIPASAQQSNPFASDPRAAGAGGIIFRAQCATCHGADAKGISSIDAPDLTLMWMQPGMNEGRVFSRIRDGVAGSIMPPHDFPDAQIWMLVSYLRSVAVSGATREFTGDAASGERLFSNYCVECHRVGIEGGSLGPSLEGITRRRSQAELTLSVRDPSESIARGYKTITLSTARDGELLGIIKGEDAFSIQILDRDQRLRGFYKADLLSSNREVDSLMPVLTERQLSDAQLNDILSFLHQSR